MKRLILLLFLAYVMASCKSKAEIQIEESRKQCEEAEQVIAQTREYERMLHERDSIQALMR
jgi:uncharacterized protein YcfL